jgi:hypothetical protein
MTTVAPTPDIASMRPDLIVPALRDGAPAAGKRIRQQIPAYAGSDVHHVLYLPTDWQPGAPRRFPLLVEYAGNGDYRDDRGDVCTGVVEGSNLGYGISGGKGFIWLCLPFVDSQTGSNQKLWWGDIDAGIAYAREAIRSTCEEYHGDPNAVILTGFSRGAIGCSFLGLHNDAAADMWLAFVPYSHYDGVRSWPYPGSDRDAAAGRVRRLGGRASFVCDEAGTAATQEFLASTGVQAPFTFLRTPFRNHNDAWTLRDTPERAALRRWLAEVLETRPGTHAIAGRVTDAAGRGVAGVRVESGPTHFAVPDATGGYRLAGLIDSGRVVQPVKEGLAFTPARREVRVAGGDVTEVNFRTC